MDFYHSVALGTCILSGVLLYYYPEPVIKVISQGLFEIQLQVFGKCRIIEFDGLLCRVALFYQDSWHEVVFVMGKGSLYDQAVKQFEKNQTDDILMVTMETSNEQELECMGVTDTYKALLHSDVSHNWNYFLNLYQGRLKNSNITFDFWLGDWNDATENHVYVKYDSQVQDDVISVKEFHQKYVIKVNGDKDKNDDDEPMTPRMFD